MREFKNGKGSAGNAGFMLTVVLMFIQQELVKHGKDANLLKHFRLETGRSDKSNETKINGHKTRNVIGEIIVYRRAFRGHFSQKVLHFEVTLLFEDMSTGDFTSQIKVQDGNVWD